MYLDLYAETLKYGVLPLVGIVGLTVLIGLTAGHALKLKTREVVLLSLAFSAIGAVTGLFMGGSRDSVVGTVVPAFLTVVSGLATYQFAARGRTYESWRTILPVAIACMFLAADAGRDIRRVDAQTTRAGATPLCRVASPLRAGNAAGGSGPVQTEIWTANAARSGAKLPLSRSGAGAVGPLHPDNPSRQARGSISQLRNGRSTLFFPDNRLASRLVEKGVRTGDRRLRFATFATEQSNFD